MESRSTIPDYEKIEIQQIYEQIRASDAMYVQVYSFFGTANVTVLGFGFTFQMAGLILLGASMIGLLALVERIIKKYRYAFYLRGLELEKRFSETPNEALLQRQVSVYRVSGSRLKRFWLPGMILLIEILIALFLHFILGWKWF
ncbi:MAG: hypothetical protein U0X20_31200 [Caldilineaceae bacterium]